MAVPRRVPTTTMQNAAIILAAGKGTRMSSDLPKVLHDVGGKPMVGHVIDALRPLTAGRIYLIVGYRAELVEEVCKDEGVHFVLQREQLGTGHAVMQAEQALGEFDGTVLVLNGDVPCIRTATIEAFVRYHQAEGAAATVMTARLEDASGYGRIIREPDGSLARIVEHKDASGGERAINEINSGLFCFDRRRLFEALEATSRDNTQGEYYLTDVIEVLKARGEPVRACCVDDAREVTGVNTDAELDAIRGSFEG